MSATPLAGLTVVDLSRHLPGPLAARLLADLGARVIKIEEPETGDPVRAAPPARNGTSALAAALLDGLESVALDLKRPAAREVLAALLARADVLLETFRPGALARLGFSPAELAERYPRLVVCSLSGFGQAGPAAMRAGHDLTYQAMAGLLAPTGRMPAAPLADLTGAWSAATAILAALHERERSGRGAWIDASLLDAALHANLVAWTSETGRPRRVGEPHDLAGALPCYNLYRSADGALVALALLERKFWQRFCRALGRRDLLRLQYRRGAEAERRVADLVRSKRAAEWQAMFEAQDLPAQVVLSAAEAARQPQVLARGVLATGPDGLPRLAFPARFDGERPGVPAPLPELGAATRPVLAELGSPHAGASRRTLARLGLGPRWSWRRILWRLFIGSNG